MNGITSGKSWEKNFTRDLPLISKKIRTVIERLVKNTLVKGIDAMVYEKLKGKYSVDKINEMIKNCHKTGDIPIEIVKVQISVSFDMGWQKKGAGCNYNNNYGHTYLIGCRTEKVIGMLVYSKKYTICDDIAKYSLPEDEEHDFSSNCRSGLSNSMEAIAAFYMVVALCSN